MEDELSLFISDFAGNIEWMQQLHDYANKLMSIPDIAVLIGVDRDLLTMAIRDNGNAVANAYYRGKAERVLAMHEADINDKHTDNLHAFLQQMNAAEY